MVLPYTKPLEVVGGSASRTGNSPKREKINNHFTNKNNITMSVLTIDILNPKAEELLRNLADLQLIAIKDKKNNPFLQVVARLRKKSETNAPSLEEITKEVEKVRAKRYEEKK